MHVFIAADHGGYHQKQFLATALRDLGHEVEDLGTDSPTKPDDYPDYAVAVGKAVQQKPEAQGILLCRSGEGMEMMVNKLKGIRAALVWRPDVAAETRRDNDANVLVLPADFVAESDMVAISKTFLETPFSGEERHARRIAKMATLEEEL